MESDYAHETNIYSALKHVILTGINQASLHMDSVDFLKLISEIKEVIQDYEDEAQTYVPLQSK